MGAEWQMGSRWEFCPASWFRSWPRQKLSGPSQRPGPTSPPGGAAGASLFPARPPQWPSPPARLLPGKSHGWRSLVGCRPWGCEESDTTHSHSPFPLEAYRPLSWEGRPSPAVQGRRPGAVLPRPLGSGALAEARADLPSRGSRRGLTLPSQASTVAQPSCSMADAAARPSRDRGPAAPSASPDGDVTLALTQGASHPPGDLLSVV